MLTLYSFLFSVLQQSRPTVVVRFGFLFAIRSMMTARVFFAARVRSWPWSMSPSMFMIRPIAATTTLNFIRRCWSSPPSMVIIFIWTWAVGSMAFLFFAFFRLMLLLTFFVWLFLADSIFKHLDLLLNFFQDHRIAVDLLSLLQFFLFDQD